MTAITDVTTSLSAGQLAQLHDAFAADPVLKRTQNAIARVSVGEIAIDHQCATAMTPTVSNRIDDWKVTNQKKSGRCWLFAALNPLRAGANYFLASILQTADRPEDDQLVVQLLRDVMGDGCQWDMAANIFTKYGAVPKTDMPETEPSSNTGRMNAVLYLNVGISLAKRLAKEAILDGEPVWFGCDVGPQMVRKDGIWDAQLYDYAGLYGAELAMDKQARVRFGETRRWRVENSWGEENGDQGFYTMADNWFDEYVSEVVVDKNRLSPGLRQALTASPTVLPAWDPMGALA